MRVLRWTLTYLAPSFLEFEYICTEFPNERRNEGAKYVNVHMRTPIINWPCGRSDVGQTTCRCKCGWLFVGGKWNPIRLLFLNSTGMIFPATVSISFQGFKFCIKTVATDITLECGGEIWHKNDRSRHWFPSNLTGIQFVMWSPTTGRSQIWSWNLTSSKSRFDLSSSRASVKCTFGIINWWILEAGLKSEKEIDNFHSFSSILDWNKLLQF